MPEYPHAAKTLKEAHRTLSPRPLVTAAERADFYSSPIHLARGGDKVELLAIGVEDEIGYSFYKHLVVGHSGVGKSTELNRLADRLAGTVRTIIFSANRDLNPTALQPFDPLILMMIRAAEETNALGLDLDDSFLNELLAFFDTEKAITKTSLDTAVGAEAGIGPAPDSLWGKALGLFARLKGEIKYASSRSNEVTQYRMTRLADLIGLANALLDECNRLLNEKEDKHWLFIGDDFEKPGIPRPRIFEIFVAYRNILQNLHCHLILTVPVELAYSEHHANLLPFDVLPDTPVFDALHQPHVTGRNGVSEALDRRISPTLFAPAQRERLLVASGGNLTDLFRLVSDASRQARVHSAEVIGEADATYAMNQLRAEYRSALGENPYEEEPVTYDRKAERLIAIYDQAPKHEIPDPVLHSLLRARAVQEFNGKRWFGVHPLVVDIMEDQKLLTPPSGSGVLGGTRS